MANLKDIIYISNEDYETLVTEGSVIINGVTVTYNPNSLYLTPETQNVKSVNNILPDANGNVSVAISGGTVTSVGAGTGLSISGTATVNPTINIASGYKLPTTTEWSNIPQGTVTSVDSVSPTSGNVALSAIRYVSQSLNDSQKAQARTNIGAGTSNFTGYTSSNKLDSAYITNNAGWVTGSVVTTSGSQSVTIGSNTLSFGSNAFNSTAIPTSYVVSSAYNSSTKKLTITPNSGTATEVTFGANAFTSTTIPTTYLSSASASGNTLTLVPNSGTNITFTPTFTEQHIGDVISVGATSNSGIAISGTTANPTVGIASGYKLPTTEEWNSKGTYSKPSGGIPASDLAESYYLSSNPSGYQTESNVTTLITNKINLLDVDEFNIYNVDSGSGLVTLYKLKEVDGKIATGTTSINSIATSSYVQNYVASQVSSAGNAVTNKIVSRHANGSIQTEKIAISSGTTTKATMQYNSTDDCIEFIFS